MRHSIFIFLLILILSLALIGCSDGSSASSGPVKVSLAVDSSSGSAANVVTVTENIDPTKFAYYYLAKPLWTGSDFTTIQGDTAGRYARITNYLTSKDIGFFAQGKWHFDVEVRLADETVVYTGSVDQYINADNNTVEVLVTKNTDAYGFVTIDSIKAPTVDGNIDDEVISDKLIITYEGPASGSIADDDISIKHSTVESDQRTKFTTVDAIPLKAGDYIFFFTYNDGTSDVGGAIKSVSIIPGVTTNISGTIETGPWKDETFKLTTGNPLEIKVSSDKTEVPKTGSATYTCTKVAGPDITTYSWYVNWELQDGQTASTFTLTASDYESFGDYCTVTCVAKAVDDTTSEEFLAASSLYLIFTE